MNDIRVGDSVLVRCEVVSSSDGDAIKLCNGGAKFSFNGLDIVSVEQEFRVGDYYKAKDSVDNGQIINLSPKGFEPRLAWVKSVRSERLTTRDIRSMIRVPKAEGFDA